MSKTAAERYGRVLPVAKYIGPRTQMDYEIDALELGALVAISFLYPVAPDRIR